MTRLCDPGRIARRGLTITSAILAALGAGLAGCAANTDKGMLVGGAGGATAGATIEPGSGHAGSGAVIGGSVGLIGGELAGNSVDQPEKRHDKYTATASPAGTVAVDDVLAWSRKGASDEVIIDRIERSGTVFHLTAADEGTLRGQGVSDDVVSAMKATERR